MPDSPYEGEKNQLPRKKEERRERCWLWKKRCGLQFVQEQELDMESGQLQFCYTSHKPLKKNQPLLKFLLVSLKY